MDYLEEKLISVNEFFRRAKRLEEDLREKGGSDDEVEDGKVNLLALQFATREYIERQAKEPDMYPGVSADKIGEIYPYVEAVHQEMQPDDGGIKVLEGIDIASATLLVRDSYNAIKRCGVADSVKERITKSVANAIGKIVETGLNDAAGQYINEEAKLLESGAILKRYPNFVTTMTDEVTQKIFKNKVQREEPYAYPITRSPKKKDIGTIIMTSCCDGDDGHRADIEKPFSTYDWAVMEAVSTLYRYAESEGKLYNGKLIIDIKSIDKILRHDLSSRMSVETKGKLQEEDLCKSIRRLCGNHVQISEESGEYAGYLIDGEFKMIGNKLCLIVNEKPVLYDFADRNGRNYIHAIPLDDLKLKMIYTPERIAIYRFLMERTLEIFGSFKKDEGYVKPKRTNSIPISSVIEAVYPEGLDAFVDSRSKERWIVENVNVVCEAMKKKGFFTGYAEDGNKGYIRIILERS